jgi:hypothetical protein
MMSYMMVFGVALVSAALWIFLLYREFGNSQAKQRKSQAAQRQKFSRPGPAADNGSREKPRRKTREFGHR